MEHAGAEPVIEILAAAFGVSRGVLRLALRAARLASDAHVEMIIVPPPRAHLVQEATIIAGLTTERLLDRRIDEDALHFRVLGGGLDHREVAPRPDFGIDILFVLRHHVGCRHLLALLPREWRLRHRREPDVGVEADLMTGVAGEHWPATRLRHVADQQARPTGNFRYFVSEAFHEGDQFRMPPVAMTR